MVHPVSYHVVPYGVRRLMALPGGKLGCCPMLQLWTAEVLSFLRRATARYAKQKFL